MAKHMEDGLDNSNHVDLTIASPPVPDRSIRHEYPVFIGEFAGTFLFLFLAFVGTSIATVSATVVDKDTGVLAFSEVQTVSKLLYISLSFGFSLAICISLFAEISGAMFNPAVSAFPIISFLSSGLRHAQRSTVRIVPCATRLAHTVVPPTRNVVHA